MLIDGLVVLLLGIGFVFAFLGLLVLSLRLLSSGVQGWERAHPDAHHGAGSEERMDAVAAAVAAAMVAARRKES